MTEKGSDELLAELGGDDLNFRVDADQEALDAEEDRVLAAEPEDDPGRTYSTPDETPDGEHEEYDTNPSEEP